MAGKRADLEFSESRRSFMKASGRGYLGLIGLFYLGGAAASIGGCMSGKRMANNEQKRGLDQCLSDDGNCPVTEELDTEGLDNLFDDIEKQQCTGEYEIVVSLNDAKLYVLQDSFIVKQFDVAVGSPKKPTPIGEYILYDKVKDPAWFFPKSMKNYAQLKEKYPGGFILGRDPKNPVQGYWIYLKDADGNKMSFGIHGTNSPESVGKHVSNGCIRMTKKDIIYIAETVPRNSIVRIVDMANPVEFCGSMTLDIYFKKDAEQTEISAQGALK